MEQLLQSDKKLAEFQDYLIENERSALTIDKYTRDIRAFYAYLDGREPSKALALEYKQHLAEQYKPASVNSMLAALNSYFTFCGLLHLKVKPLKIQRNMFAAPERELTKDEYKRLLSAAKLRKNERLNLVMQTICSTGIRVSELKFITVEAVRSGRAEVNCKGKRRTVFIPPELRKLLLPYIERRGIINCVFISKNGNPLNRHAIWRDMKALCEDARVTPTKVFPHNLRHLFARCFHAIEKDLARLADVLGHSNVNTTRIYTKECGREHERIMARLSLVYK